MGNLCNSCFISEHVPASEVNVHKGKTCKINIIDQSENVYRKFN